MEGRVKHYGLFLILGVVLLMRLPFLGQAIQGDDPKYIAVAQHALIDPAHPSHAKYAFQGVVVDMRGHPHPPLNAWILAGLIAVFGDVYEVPFHAVYLIFSLIAAVSVWVLSGRSLWATLLFVATPAFVINGNSLESDIPPLAFFLAAVALYTTGRYAWAALPLVFAAMGAYQSVVATPVLLAYCWFHARREKTAWVVAFVPVVVIACYQLYERATSGALPAAVLAGYFSEYGLQQATKKLQNAIGLTAHAGWIVFPGAVIIAFRRMWPVGVAAAALGLAIDTHPLFWVSFGAGAMVLAWCLRGLDFMRAWVLIFFAAALVLFFAGSARYLLPMAAPVAILVAREGKWLRTAFAVNLAIGMGLAWVNYQHWDGYRDFIASLRKDMQQRRVWVNGEWGFRFYAESEGALPLLRATPPQTGDWILSSELSLPEPVTAPLAVVAEREIRASLPLRIVGLGAAAGYSSVDFGSRPFDVSLHPIDRVRVQAVLERKPVLSWLPMNAPEANAQIVTGVYQLEDGRSRWMSGRAVVLLKTPERPSSLTVELFVPDSAPARSVTLSLDGVQIHQQALPGPGMHKITTPAAVSGSALTIALDKSFSVPGDSRELGAVLVAAGFQ